MLISALEIVNTLYFDLVNDICFDFLHFIHIGATQHCLWILSYKLFILIQSVHFKLTFVWQFERIYLLWDSSEKWTNKTHEIPLIWLSINVGWI